MAIDVSLILDQDAVVVSDESKDYIEVEGGQLCWAHLVTGAMSGSSTTCDVRVQFSPDEGLNYYQAGKFQQLGPSNDNARMSIPVYIPRPETPGTKVRVRANYDVAGSSPSYAVTLLYLDPMVTIAPPAADDDTVSGAAAQVAAV